MRPVVFWSDILIYLLVIGLVLLFTLFKPNPQTRAHWAQVFSSKMGSATFLVLCVYVFIALLDSMHFQKALPKGADDQVFYSSEVLSVLDWVHLEQRNKQEKTYSAPFALYAFAKENMHTEDGQLYRDYPRLKYGGRHLNNADERGADIARRSGLAIAKGALYGSFLVAILLRLQRRHVAPSAAPKATIYGLLFAIVVLWVWVLELGSHYHIMGTDKVGADVLYQSIKSIRTGVLIGSLATLLTLPFAIGLGICAGYFKGRVDDAVQYLYTTLSSIPDILLIAAAVLVIDVYIENHAQTFSLTAYRADFKFLALCTIFGLTSWTGLCRLLRAETLKVSQLDYVTAATAFGVSHAGIIIKHILPNVMHLVIISVVLNFSTFVLAESVLSYIGVGVDQSINSWGNMINSARQELSRDPTVWWSIFSAFMFMFILVLSANLFSDRVRDAFDPRMTQSGDTDT